MTPAQLATLNTYIQSVPEWAALPNNTNTAALIAEALNQLATPDFLLWRTDAQVSAIYDAIDYTKFTPTDAPDNTVTFTNRALAIQTKQMNLQLMLQGRQTVDASKANIRTGLRDAVTALPSGAGGGSVSAAGASGVNVLNALLRKATLAEKVLSAGSAQTGTVTANLIGWEGIVSNSDVETARGS